MRCLAVLVLLSWIGGVAGQELPKMEFNETKEIAPGVFFRYSSISATDLKVPFGGSNHAWVVFDDFVVVIDANFPRQAQDVLKDIRKTTNKPIRYVLDTHHHGDHAYGNAVWAKEGATIVGQTNCFRLLTTVGPEQFRMAAERDENVKGSTLKAPSLVFDERLVLDDGKQRVEFLWFGHAHTPGDAVAYLPKHKILCTGDACVNGAFNYMGHSDTKSWMRVLDKMGELDVQMICPGHGPVAGKDLLAKQKRYFQELREQVQKGITANKKVEDVIPTIEMPWYKEWTGKEAAKNDDNVKHVFNELSGKIDHNALGLHFDLREGGEYHRDAPGWTRPRRILLPNLTPTRIAELRTVAPEVEFVVARTAAEAQRLAPTSDGVLGYLLPEVIQAGGRIRWVHGSLSDKVARGSLQERGITRTYWPAGRPADPEGEWRLCRENVRRFAAGEKLLSVHVP